MQQQKNIIVQCLADIVEGMKAAKAYYWQLYLDDPGQTNITEESETARRVNDYKEDTAIPEESLEILANDVKRIARANPQQVFYITYKKVKKGSGDTKYGPLAFTYEEQQINGNPIGSILPHQMLQLGGGYLPKEIFDTQLGLISQKATLETQKQIDDLKFEQRKSDLEREYKQKMEALNAREKELNERAKEYDSDVKKIEKGFKKGLFHFIEQFADDTVKSDKPLAGVDTETKKGQYIKVLVETINDEVEDADIVKQICQGVGRFLKSYKKLGQGSFNYEEEVKQ